MKIFQFKHFSKNAFQEIKLKDPLENQADLVYNLFKSDWNSNFRLFSVVKDCKE